MRSRVTLAMMLAAAGCTGGYGATVPPDAGTRAAHPGGAAMTTQSEGKPFGPVVAGRFYPGEVTKVEGTTYTVKWDDGSQPSGVAAGKIIAE